MTATPKIIEQAQDELLWWQAANLEFPGAYRDQLASAQKRLRFLQRAAKLPPSQAKTIPQETIDRVMELATMPDIIPDILRDFCGLTLEWKPGAKQGKLQTCPLCANSRYNWEINLRSGLWHCWACTEGGSLKWLLLRFSGLGFRPLFERLGAYLGVSVEPPVARGILL